MNIYDIAERAGVSTATVSRIVNHSGKVSPKTEARVRAIMEELQYQPNIFAQGMVTNSMKTIGVLAADIRDTYYATVTYSIEQILSDNGYHVMLCNTGEEPAQKLKYLNSLTGKNVDAVVLVGSVFKETHLEEKIIAISKKIPVFIINGLIEQENIYCILNEDTKGTQTALSYLKTQKKEKTIFLSDAVTYSSARKAEPFSGKNVFYVPKGISGGYAFIMEQRNIFFDSIICSEDTIALGAICALRERGISIPVIGFNNTELSRNFGFPSIESNMETIGEATANALIGVIGKQAVASKIKLESKIIHHIRRETL